MILQHNKYAMGLFILQEIFSSSKVQRVKYVLCFYEKNSKAHPRISVQGDLVSPEEMRDSLLSTSVLKYILNKLG